MCVGVVAILLLNVMDVFSVCGGALLDRPCNIMWRVATKGHQCRKFQNLVRCKIR